nr:uncharacterized protein LOC112795326 [Arachis hypogaea]
MASANVNSVAPFLNKTYDMVDDSSTDSVVSWTDNSNSFVVWNVPEFASRILPKYFKIKKRRQEPLSSRSKSSAFTGRRCHGVASPSLKPVICVFIGVRRLLFSQKFESSSEAPPEYSIDSWARNFEDGSTQVKSFDDEKTGCWFSATEEDEDEQVLQT